MAEEEEEIMEELEEMSTTATTTTTTTTTFLPQEIVMDILSRLPANSLVSSFKLVCKPWRTLIYNPDFIKMHLNRGGEASINGDGDGERRISSNNNHSLICKSGNQLFQLHPPFNYESGFVIAPDIDCDLISSSSRLVSSCNGLLCLSVVNDNDESIIILNPSTRKYKLSPKQPIECPTNEFYSDGPVVYGFGCCRRNSTTTMDEYKVVRIVHFYPIIHDNHNESSFQFQMDIYSMSSNSWRRWRRDEGILCEISEDQPMIFVSGALHWTGLYSYDEDTLLSFDIRDEEFRTLPWPPSDFAQNGTLMNVKGCLGLIYVDGDMNIEIWVMKEYGIKESWTQECVIRSSNTDPPMELSSFLISLLPLACFLNGDQILIRGEYGRLALYDMNTKKFDGNFKMVGVPDEPYVDLVHYIETLVSLKSSLIPSSNNRKRKNCN